MWQHGGVSRRPVTSLKRAAESVGCRLRLRARKVNCCYVQRLARGDSQAERKEQEQQWERKRVWGGGRSSHRLSFWELAVTRTYGAWDEKEPRCEEHRCALVKLEHYRMDVGGENGLRLEEERVPD